MVINKDKFKWFPLNDIRDFESIRANPQYVYFDRTGYISKLESFPGNVLLFLRPRRFGKSLFLSTLAHFHGVQHKHNYKALFQFLDVDKDVINKKVISGQYLILAFDFSKVDRSPDLNTAQNNLRDMINSAIENFYQVYAPYLGNKSSVQLIQDKITPDNSVQSLDRCVNLVREALNGVVRTDNPLYGVKGIYLLADEYDAFSNEYLDPDDSRPWNQLRTGPNSLLKGFWATVKGSIGPRSIVKCFITGVSPLSMADHTSGFNIATYVSWRKELSGLCGLTEEDVLAALRLPSVCKSKYEVQKHFKIMKSHYDGYNFAELGKAPHVFNTNACLEYLDSLARGEPIEPRAISNSEVSEPALQILAASPIATSVISDSLKNKILASSTPANHLIPYNELVQSFRLTHLASDIATSKPAWLSYMLHIGGLTFSRKTKNLEVPNLVAAERFGKAVLDRAGLRYEDVSLAYKNIVSTGNISQVLRLYRQTMCKIDVGIDAFKKEEEHHRNSFYHALLGNTLPSLRDIGLEVNVSKPARQGTGRIDMLIHVPSKKRVLLLEWKVIRIDFLEIKDSPSIEKKVEHLSGTFEATDILNLQFGKNDMRRAGQTIKEWILNGFPQRKGHQSGVSPCQQLREYFTSPEITQLKKEQDVTAYLVVVIGNRQILFWEMDNDGTFQKDAQLA
ncbi:hypothetical protein BGZ46_007936 [Entomortierella lignicola]|nr:hypothetical protein BGZ46_007936 [Entomortierella lignicola]